MIPTLIAFGVVFGRWWRTALAVGVTYWVVALLAWNNLAAASIPSAAALALLNTGVGVLVHQSVLRGVRRILVRRAQR